MKTQHTSLYQTRTFTRNFNLSPLQKQRDNQNFNFSTDIIIPECPPPQNDPGRTSIALQPKKVIMKAEFKDNDLDTQQIHSSNRLSQTLRPFQFKKHKSSGVNLLKDYINFSLLNNLEVKLTPLKRELEPINKNSSPTLKRERSRSRIETRDRSKGFKENSSTLCLAVEGIKQMSVKDDLRDEKRNTEPAQNFSLSATLPRHSNKKPNGDTSQLNLKEGSTQPLIFIDDMYNERFSVKANKSISQNKIDGYETRNKALHQKKQLSIWTLSTPQGTLGSFCLDQGNTTKERRSPVSFDIKDPQNIIIHQKGFSEAKKDSHNNLTRKLRVSMVKNPLEKAQNNHEFSIRTEGPEPVGSHKITLSKSAVMSLQPEKTEVQAVNRPSKMMLLDMRHNHKNKSPDTLDSGSTNINKTVDLTSIRTNSPKRDAEGEFPSSFGKRRLKKPVHGISIDKSGANEEAIKSSMNSSDTNVKYPSLEVLGEIVREKKRVDMRGVKESLEKWNTENIDSSRNQIEPDEQEDKNNKESQNRSGSRGNAMRSIDLVRKKTTFVDRSGDMNGEGTNFNKEESMVFLENKLKNQLGKNDALDGWGQVPSITEFDPPMITNQAKPTNGRRRVYNK